MLLMLDTSLFGCRGCVYIGHVIRLEKMHLGVWLNQESRTELSASIAISSQEMEHGGESSKMRNLSGPELLKQLPVLQRLQLRLMDCKPSGVAAHDSVVQAALMAVLKESFKVYKAISEGIINLADRFFEMDYLDAQKGLEIYKESIVGNTRLQVILSLQQERLHTQFTKELFCSCCGQILTSMLGFMVGRYCFDHVKDLL